MWNKIDLNPKERVSQDASFSVLLCYTDYSYSLVMWININATRLKLELSEEGKFEITGLRMREETSDVSGWISLVNIGE